MLEMCVTPGKSEGEILVLAVAEQTTRLRKFWPIHHLSKHDLLVATEQKDYYSPFLKVAFSFTHPFF